MRKIDEDKSTVVGKAAKTINFDKIVLLKLEERAKEEGTTASNLVNQIVRRIVMTDYHYYQQKAKQLYLAFQEANYMKEQAQIIVNTKTS